MTMNLYTRFKTWHRETRQEDQNRRAVSAPPLHAHAAMKHEAAAFYAAFAAMGCGLGGMACADTMEAHSR
ncbi:MAG: hypothetical protein AB1421_15445 [Pseudomonadota bacterium]